MPVRCPTSARAEAAAVCTVAAHVAWVEGDGALARAAIDRALRLVPGYRLALLLERLVDAGLRLPRRRDPGDDGPLLSRAADERGWRPRCLPRSRPRYPARSRVTGVAERSGRRWRRLGTMGAGHESQCQTPVCWAATLLAVGCPG